MKAKALASICSLIAACSFESTVKAAPDESRLKVLGSLDLGLATDQTLRGMLDLTLTGGVLYAPVQMFALIDSNGDFFQTAELALVWRFRSKTAQSRRELVLACPTYSDDDLERR
jgi:hypothetical protein